ncbi:hypothetical protein VNI00_006782 [Paramarasmius palmivorus]|uniref:Uncharacterized protein n=1 Tax=Paramarasmius palmivorus TaxID=297713 RepID=A0AAW0D840_9AGAR
MILLFNNAGLMAGVYNEDSARGMIIELDFGAMSATLIHDYLPWSLAVSETQGSTQVQPNGDVLIGWGSMPWVSEHSPSGELLWAGQFGVDTTIGGYRALRYNWTGSPMTKPSIELVNGRSSILSVYASWNGATEIQRWELFGALDAEGTNAVSLYNRTKNGFETTITIPTNLEMYEAYTHFAMRALDKENQPLGQSTFVSLNGVLGFTISTRSQWWIAVAMASVWILQWIL